MIVRIEPGPSARPGTVTVSEPIVGVLMGSASDWPTMKAAVAVLERFEVAHEAKVISAHRMPDETFAYAEAAAGRGLRAIIAGAGGAAALPGVLAAKTTVPVLGVPVPSGHLQGQDAMLSMVQMPPGIPVATFAIGEAGATNAALFAVALLAASDSRLDRGVAGVPGGAPRRGRIFDAAAAHALESRIGCHGTQFAAETGAQLTLTPTSWPIP